MKRENRKNWLVFCAVCGLLAVLAFLLYPQDTTETEYIFDKNDGISLQDMEKAKQPLSGGFRPADRASDETGRTKTDRSTGQDAAEPSDSGLDIKELLSRGVINSHTTLSYFQYLEHRFRKTATMGAHLSEVRKHLESRFPAKEAGRLFAIYSKYLRCETQLQNEYRNFSAADSPGEAIEMLRRIQDFRRAQLGEELADKLFGAAVKKKEYAFRRAAIISDRSLYGREKEERIRELNRQMWADPDGPLESGEDAYSRYQEKLRIYRKDLAEMPSQQARHEKLMEIRKNTFDPETAQALASIDREIAEDRQREDEYRREKEEIQKNPDISDAQKQQRVERLREKTFGEDAEAFRRREAIREAKEKRIREGTAPDNGQTR